MAKGSKQVNETERAGTVKSGDIRKQQRGKTVMIWLMVKKSGRNRKSRDSKEWGYIRAMFANPKKPSKKIIVGID